MIETYKYSPGMYEDINFIFSVSAHHALNIQLIIITLKNKAYIFMACFTLNSMKIMEILSMDI